MMKEGCQGELLAWGTAAAQLGRCGRYSGNINEHMATLGAREG